MNCKITVGSSGRVMSTLFLVIYRFRQDLPSQLLQPQVWLAGQFEWQLVMPLFQTHSKMPLGPEIKSTPCMHFKFM